MTFSSPPKAAAGKVDMGTSPQSHLCTGLRYPVEPRQDISDRTTMSSITRHAACIDCRQRKVRCDGGQPYCRNCRRRSVKCIYVRTSGQDRQEMLFMIKELSDRLCSSTICHRWPTPLVQTTVAGANQTLLKQHMQKTLWPHKRLLFHRYRTTHQGSTLQTSPRTTRCTFRQCPMETAHRLLKTTGL